tara:strand:+ start:49 stop:1608 length:1560 start_codon:yes stop_codon:yes gene_type:complete
MAIFLYSNNELIPYTLGDILSDPIRAEFLVSDTETIFDVIIKHTDDEIVNVTLPLVAFVNGKHYYSLPWKFFDSIDLSESFAPVGPQEVKWSSDTAFNSVGVAKFAQRTVGNTLYAIESQGADNLTLNVFDVSSGISYLRSLTMTTTGFTALHYAVNSNYLVVFFKASYPSMTHKVKVYTHTQGENLTLLKTLEVIGNIMVATPLNIHLTNNNKLIVSLFDKDFKAYPYNEGSGNTYIYSCTSTDVTLQQTITNPSKKIAIEASDDYLVFAFRLGDQGYGDASGDKTLRIYKFNSENDNYEVDHTINLVTIANDGVSSAKLSSDNSTLITVTSTHEQSGQNSHADYNNKTTTFYNKCLSHYSITSNYSSTCNTRGPKKSNIKFYKLNNENRFELSAEFDDTPLTHEASIDINSNYAIVGAMVGDASLSDGLEHWNYDKTDNGKVFVYKYNGSTWTLNDTKKSAEVEEFGSGWATSNIMGFRAFAYNVSLVNDTNILVHAPLDRKNDNGEIQNTIYSVSI